MKKHHLSLKARYEDVVSASDGSILLQDLTWRQKLWIRIQRFHFGSESPNGRGRRLQ